jgi:hypothetical protein
MHETSKQRRATSSPEQVHRVLQVHSHQPDISFETDAPANDGEPSLITKQTDPFIDDSPASCAFTQQHPLSLIRA